MARDKADPVVEALAKVDLFTGLTTKELTVIAGLAKEASFDEGAAIVTEGDATARFYVLLSGTAAVEHGGKVIAELGPGAYIGEIAVLDDGPRTATVRATSPVQAVSLASFSLRPVLKQHPDTLMKLVVRLCQRLREAQADPTH
jgi:CRP/FNR family transcriptional regulator, cyclic AMP receptor protein